MPAILIYAKKVRYFFTTLWYELTIQKWSASILNIIKKLHLWGIKNPGSSRKTSGYSFWEADGFPGFPWTWYHFTSMFKTLKQGLSRAWKHRRKFCYTMKTLGLTPHKPLKRQLWNLIFGVLSHLPFSPIYSHLFAKWNNKLTSMYLTQMKRWKGLLRFD